MKSARLSHLYISTPPKTQELIPPTGRGNQKYRDVEHRSHGQRLLNDLTDSFDSSDFQRNNFPSIPEELRSLGSIIVIESDDEAYRLEIDRLTKWTNHKIKRPMWILLSLVNSSSGEFATVWVSDQYRDKFLKLFEDYIETTPNKSPEENSSEQKKHSNKRLIANISRIRQGVLLDLWTSTQPPKQKGKHWWELWLHSDETSRDTLEKITELQNIRVLPRHLSIQDRDIFWVEATWDQLQLLPFQNVSLAEVRAPDFLDTLEDLPVEAQFEYTEDLKLRVIPAPNEAVAVCLLDTGVFRKHQLIEHSLSDEDQHTIFGEVGNDVHHLGHGTAMAGIALLGEIDSLLLSNQEVQLNHRLESVRMLAGEDEMDLDQLSVGTATVDSVSKVEINNSRNRVFSLTLSDKPDGKPGEPTLWSSTIDALAAGTDVVRKDDELQLLSVPDRDASRLFIIAAGNVDQYSRNFLDESDTSPIENPGQAWNALTVGAFTNLTDLPTDPSYKDWSVLAEKGELSPHSRTSLLFGNKGWPIKPDICMEGGNALTDGSQLFETRHPLVSLRTTGHENDLSLVSANATSSATAQAARLAALTMHKYPSYWTETIRGLMTHRAEWTPLMYAKIDAATTKQARLALLRRYGWGVPSEETLLNSSFNSATLISQDEFRPFSGKDFSQREFRLHTLPWPKEVLEMLGTQIVRLRVTLSYFIEPTASRRGWRQRYTYPSHSLRFDLQNSGENQQDFIRRINRQLDKDTRRSTTQSDRWLIGSKQRNIGSLHQDEWSGYGVDLATCNSIAIYPVGGWWKNNKTKNRQKTPVRYSLILSLQTESENIDLYTPIANQLEIRTSTEVKIF